MKKIFLTFHMLWVIGFVYSQAKNDIVVYKRTHQPAASISLPYEPDLITAVLNDQLTKKGTQSGDLEGFKIYRNAQFVLGDSRRADLYFKIIRNNMSDTDASIIYLMVGMPNENIAKRNQETHFTKEHAKAYLNYLVPEIEAYNLEFLIKQQNETVMQEEMRYNHLVKDGAELNKRKNTNQQKLLRNKHDQDLQNDEVERQKLALSYLISQRKF
jgi:hypothetical protein